MGTTRTDPPYVAAIDANQYPTLTAVSGTLGTADTSGTAEVVRVGVNPANGALYVDTSLTPGGGAAVSITSGTQQTLGTVGTVNGVGTLTGLGVVSNLTNGSVNILTGTIQSSGTTTGVGVVSALTNGSVNILTGTLQSSGTTTGVGVVSALTNGSVNILTGTLQSSGTTTGVGVVSNLTNGSVNILTGTLQSSGTTTGVGVVSNLTNGSVNILTGTVTLLSTVTTVSNLTNGSINLLTGTLTRASNLGTLELGTVKNEPTTIPQMVQFGTLGTAGGSFFATISAASGAGTKHYVQGVDIVMNTGTADIRILAGSSIQGTGVLAAGNFVQGGGIAKNWWPHFNTGTGSELIYHFVGAGTAFITLSYWKGA